MTDIFRIMEGEDCNEEKGKGVYIGIDVTVAGKRLPCPISDVCYSSGDLEKEIQKIKDHLNLLLEKGKVLLSSSATGSTLKITPEMPANEVWVKLGEITEDNVFVDMFNSLDEEKRKEIAEYVLTQCNIFSGKGAYFSQHYDNESGYMEV